ncbi:MAG: hypothetical protein DMF56_01090 [Acidobacteria bacterium]|nr:MAG: hypothetical protein DMF56_01090 [Acidobacteriota bacterium]
MRRCFVLALVLVTVSSHAVTKRRAVAQPSAPKRLTSWRIEVTTSGGFAPAVRTSIALQSTGNATLLDFLGRPLCASSVTDSELASLATGVAQARPESWAPSYVSASNPTGCCDQIRTSVKLTRAFSDHTTATNQSYWFDVHPELPADLNALYDTAFGAASTRSRIEPACLSDAALKTWSLDITEDGGAGYRYHRVSLDSSGNVFVQPNLRSGACRYAIAESEGRELSDAVLTANAAAWSSSYVRPENPNGCCDQIHTVVRMSRNERGPDGAAIPVTYTTEWYSDHPLLPADLEHLHERLLGNDSSLFARFGAQCGPLF